jgi:propionate CoA-transferase
LQVFFCGTFTAGKSQIHVTDGNLVIEQDGSIHKFIDTVQQITFSADIARKNNKEIIYITERAVFKLVAEGLELIEVAPGVDVEKDILAKMDFAPIVSSDLKLMDARIFQEEPMNLVLKNM